MCVVRERERKKGKMPCLRTHTINFTVSFTNYLSIGIYIYVYISVCVCVCVVRERERKKGKNDLFENTHNKLYCQFHELFIDQQSIV